MMSMNKKILYILYMNSLLPFLSIGNIFSFTGGARKKGTKKKTKRTQRTKKKVVNTKKLETRTASIVAITSRGFLFIFIKVFFNT